MNAPYTITALGDGALLVNFGNEIDEGTNKTVLRLFYKLQQLSVFGITDVVPAYSSLAVYYDVAAFYQKETSAFEGMKQKMEGLLKEENTEGLLQGRFLRVPVCYEKDFAPDLEALAFEKGLTAEEVIHLHKTRPYRVYMIGFLPGFAYLGKVDERIATQRKAGPVNVAAGAVGIAGNQTGIYPLLSPGGWHIIGRTPAKLFDKKKEEPVWLQPGDEITFYSITQDEFKNY